MNLCLGPCEKGLPLGWGASCEGPPAASWTFHGRLCRCGPLSIDKWDASKGSNTASGERVSGKLMILGTLLWSGRERAGLCFGAPVIGAGAGEHLGGQHFL